MTFSSVGTLAKRLDKPACLVLSLGETRSIRVDPGDVQILPPLVKLVLHGLQSDPKRLAPLRGRIDHRFEQCDLEDRIHVVLPDDRVDQFDHDGFPTAQPGRVRQDRLELACEVGLGRQIPRGDPTTENRPILRLAVEVDLALEMDEATAFLGLLDRVVAQLSLPAISILDHHHPEMIDQRFRKQFLELAGRVDVSAGAASNRLHMSLVPDEIGDAGEIGMLLQELAARSRAELGLLGRQAMEGHRPTGREAVPGRDGLPERPLAQAFLESLGARLIGIRLEVVLEAAGEESDRARLVGRRVRDGIGDRLSETILAPEEVESIGSRLELLLEDASNALRFRIGEGDLGCQLDE